MSTPLTLTPDRHGTLQALAAITPDTTVRELVELRDRLTELRPWGQLPSTLTDSDRAEALAYVAAWEVAEGILERLPRLAQSEGLESLSHTHSEARGVCYCSHPEPEAEGSGQ